LADRIEQATADGRAELLDNLQVWAEEVRERALLEGHPDMWDDLPKCELHRLQGRTQVADELLLWVAAQRHTK